MKTQLPDIVEKARIMWDAADRDGAGTAYGRFVLRYSADTTLLVISAPGEPEAWAAWGFPAPPFDHVSVSVQHRKQTPTWEMMAWVKSLFFEPTETVIQFHPPEAVHVNYHNYCLHLWRPVGVEIPLPPIETLVPGTLGGVA